MSFNRIHTVATDVKSVGQSTSLTFALDSAERRVVRQLLEAILFEKIASFQLQDRDFVSNIPADIESVFNKIFYFTLGRYAFRAVGAVTAFDRVRLAEGSIQFSIKGNKQWCEANLESVINVLNVSDTSKHQLQQELTQTLDLYRWNNKHVKHYSSRRELNFQALESAIVEGHLYHPCFKTRTGFSEEDHTLYGPEAGNHFQLQWLAIKQHNVESTLPQQGNIFWPDEIGKNVYTYLTEQLLSFGGHWQEYQLMPIHPWQYHTIMPLGLAKAIAAKDIIPLGEAGDFYQSSQSLRTLINVSNPLKANIKLPLNVVCTSSHRNFQSHFVHTAPVISAWLQQQVASDPYLQEQNNTVLLSEYAGVLYEPENNKPLQGLIGVIFRESVLSKLEPGQSVVPFSALMLIESDGLAFINHWLEQYGVAAWLNQLLSTMLLPIWHLLAHRGIAFESHAQNLLLIHRDGWPEKIVLRDFHEDTEYVVDFLPDPKNLPKLSAVDAYFDNIALDEGFAMADVDDLRELFMDTVYVFNLADLSFLLARFYHFNEKKFWNLLKNKIDNYNEAKITDKKRIKKLGAEKKNIIVESLLKKKIMGGNALDYYEHSVNNRLAFTSSQLS